MRNQLPEDYKKCTRGYYWYKSWTEPNKLLIFFSRMKEGIMNNNKAALTKICGRTIVARSESNITLRAPPWPHILGLVTSFWWPHGGRSAQRIVHWSMYTIHIATKQRNIWNHCRPVAIPSSNKTELAKKVGYHWNDSKGHPNDD